MDEIDLLSKFLSPLISFISGEDTISVPGIVCGTIWRSIPVLGSFAVQFGDHSRARTVLLAHPRALKTRRFQLSLPKPCYSRFPNLHITCSSCRDTKRYQGLEKKVSLRLPSSRRKVVSVL